jgi:integration host factor subunit alpha
LILRERPRKSGAFFCFNGPPGQGGRKLPPGIIFAKTRRTGFPPPAKCSKIAINESGKRGRIHKMRRASEPPPDTAANRNTATRAELLDAVYASCPALSRAQAKQIFEMTLDEITDALVRGETVKLRSFGLFLVRAKRERVGRNPRTGVEVPITPRRVLTFKPSPVLSAAVNDVAAKQRRDKGYRT